jgi:leader peptidase (prepilin peptidase) / N-methyltransferase
LIEIFSSILIISCLLSLAWIDSQTFHLPDTLTLPLIAYGLIANTFLELNWTNWSSSCLGAFLGWGGLVSLNWVHRKLKGKDAIGMGDAKLLGALGACLGWQALAHILFIAAITGLVGGYIWLTMRNKSMSEAFPFGPYIALSGIIMVLWKVWIPLN